MDEMLQQKRNDLLERKEESVIRSLARKSNARGRGRERERELNAGDIRKGEVDAERYIKNGGRGLRMPTEEDEPLCVSTSSQKRRSAKRSQHI
jgi:hypothetical protein